VRVENIYRRAAGLCPRSGYGDDRLTAEPTKGCAPERCECSPAAVWTARRAPRPAAVRRQAADSGPAPGETARDRPRPLRGSGTQAYRHFVPTLTHSPLLQRKVVPRRQTVEL